MKEKVEIKMFHGKVGVEITYKGKLGITDLITENPYIEPESKNNFSSNFIIFAPAIDISEKEYNKNPENYKKAAKALNELYIDYLKTSGKFGEKYENTEPYYKRYAVKETIKNNIHEKIENYLKDQEFEKGRPYLEESYMPTYTTYESKIDLGKSTLSSYELVYLDFNKE